MSDSLDGADADFNVAVNLFGPWVNDHGGDVGVSVGDIAAIVAAVADWNLKYPAHLTAQTTAGELASQKDTARALLEGLARPAAKKIVVGDQRIAAGLNEYAVARARVPAPTTHAVITVDNSERLVHTLRWFDETTPNSRAKPDGVKHLEIRCFIGETPPADPEDFHYCAGDSKEPYVISHDAADAGKKAHIVGRWENTRGEFGPWSETVMSTISA